MSDEVITTNGDYRTVDGRKVSVIIDTDGRFAIATNLKAMEHGDPPKRSASSAQMYLRNGKVSMPRNGEENDRIVGPWVEPPVAVSPVQEVTERRIVPGHYGIVTVGRYADTGKPIASVSFGRNQTSAELRDAARVLTELADFLDA